MPNLTQLGNWVGWWGPKTETFTIFNIKFWNLTVSQRSIARTISAR